MCYVNGPLCSSYARAWVELAETRLANSQTTDSRRVARAFLDQMQLEYDGTPEGQELLEKHMVEFGDAKLVARLETAEQERAKRFAELGIEDVGDVEHAHIGQYEDTNPALSLPIPEPIGRVYRRPGDTSVRTGPNGGVILPSQAEIEQNIIDGKWLPSITNVIGVRNSPHLIGWAASKGVKAFHAMLQRSPEKIATNANGAIAYAERAAERDRDEAATRGTKIHYACEQVSLGRSVHPSYLSSEEWLYVDSFKDWMEAFKPEFIAREVTVFGTTPFGDYAGTADFIAKIGGLVVAGDYKTTRSGLHIDVAFQLSAVAHATHYTMDGKTLMPMMNIDAGVGLLLSAKGYEMRQARLRGTSWDIFCGLRAVWITHVLHGTQDDGQPSLSEPLSSPNDILAES